ncbi:hypothetical protein FVEG_17294 [Fusarium verticillioides 7600]|uniref:Uncharacterized protein n=1 Tax=Gibberella moniliformis (strain M3125 / FGSC 7600) TaxID=334819 RepID=W7NCR6_GIBM7|nr:hypothetical protein FVEG_17294 [Fusarium verticillioides 7600]EWG54307.1 hypothetical protein FVEG_17294 [Fusarium verticillioides 7600]
MPSLAVRSPSSVASGSNLVSYNRFTLVSIEMPPEISLLYGNEAPVKCWDVEDFAFFGTHGFHRNWGSFVLDTNTLFICFWHKKDSEWDFEASLLDLSRPEVYGLWKDLSLFAEQPGCHPNTVQYMLKRVEGKMQSSVKTWFKGREIKLSFKVWRAESESLCSGPRWRVVFSTTSR